MNNTIHIIGGKSDTIKNNHTEITLRFVKRYNKYYLFLSIFPTVLADMIFDYISDYFEITIRNRGDKIFINTTITLNYEQVPIKFRYNIFHFKTLIISRLKDPSRKYKLRIPCRHSCQIQYFMKKYYNRQINIPSARSHTHRCLSWPENHISNVQYSDKYVQYDDIIRHIDNHRHYKNEIIIIEKVTNYLTQIGCDIIV